MIRFHQNEWNVVYHLYQVLVRMLYLSIIVWGVHTICYFPILLLLMIWVGVPASEAALVLGYSLAVTGKVVILLVIIIRWMEKTKHHEIYVA